MKNEMKKLRLGVIFGGKSSEHEVSLRSATAVINNADKEKYDIVMIGVTRQGRWLLYDGPVSAIADGSWQKKAEDDLARDPGQYGFCVLGSAGRLLKDMIDFAFPVMHGQNAEDGSMQGLLQLLDIPYAGCGVMGSALCMDKSYAKHVCDSCGIAQTPYVDLTSGAIDEKLDEINEKLVYPLFIKPANMGSSVGITKVEKPEDLKAALEFAARYDSRLVAEQGVKGRELEVAVMGNEEPRACEVGEILAGDVFYSYDAKYNNAESQTIVGASLSAEKKEELMRLAERCYKTLGCEGYARVDFFMEENGRLLLNEINTIPGFTSISMFPMLAQASGLTYSQVIDRIVELGLERKEKRNSLVI